MLFALPLLGSRQLRSALPAWVKLAALCGLISSLVAFGVTVYPIVNVTSRFEYAMKICFVVAASNLTGLAIYRTGRRRAERLSLAMEPEDVLADSRQTGTGQG